jgi:hypothetical protein
MIRKSACCRLCRQRHNGHTFSTRAAQNNIDLSTLAALLGHGSTRCLHKYVHPTAEHKKAAMKRFDRKAEQARRQLRLPSGAVVSRSSIHHQLPT